MSGKKVIVSTCPALVFTYHDKGQSLMMVPASAVFVNWKSILANFQSTSLLSPMNNNWN